MWPYVVLILLPLALQITARRPGCSELCKQKINTNAMKLFWILLLILLVLRHESVGIDLKTYKTIFKYISANNWPVALQRSEEVGYSLLNKIISWVTDDFRWVMVATAILSIWFIGRAYVKYSTDTALTVALFITISNFIVLFSGLRQSIAISIGFIAFEFVRKKKLLPFLLTVLLAMTFHVSAFMILFMYPMYHIRIKKIWLVWIIPVLAIAMVFNQQIFGFLTSILSMFTDYDTQISLTGSYTMLILFALFAAFSYLIPDESVLDDDTRGMRNFMLLAVFIQMFAPLHTIAMRMNYYYMAFIPLLIPRIIKHRGARLSHIAVIAKHVMIIFFIIFFFVTAPKDNLLQTFPYKFFWESV